MAKQCDICGKKPMYGHRVSHAHNLTKRRWLPNLKTIRTEINGHVRRIKICTNCLKSGQVVKVV